MSDRSPVRPRTAEAFDEETDCQGCGAVGETRYVEFYQHIGLIVLFLQSSVKGELCRQCVSQHFWSTTGITLFAGWWGMMSLFITPFVLLHNVVRCLGCLGMEPARPPRAGSAWRQSGPTCSVCADRVRAVDASQKCEECGRRAHVVCARQARAAPARRGCPRCGAPTAAERDDAPARRSGPTCSVCAGRVWLTDYSRECRECGRPAHVECAREAYTAPARGGCRGCGAPAAVELDDPPSRPTGPPCSVCAEPIPAEDSSRECPACARPAHVACAGQAYTAPARRGCPGCGAPSAEHPDEW